jgi:amino acid transporter
MTLSSKQEVLCWLIGGVAVIELFLRSHTFNVIAATYYYGIALLSVVVFLFWLRFRKRSTPRPWWLRILANFVLVIVTAAFCFTPLVLQRGTSELDDRLIRTLPLNLYFRPSCFCASTNPRGVGKSTVEISPSCSSLSAASRTTFKCELASCIRIRP